MPASLGLYMAFILLLRTHTRLIISNQLKQLCSNLLLSSYSTNRETPALVTLYFMSSPSDALLPSWVPGITDLRVVQNFLPSHTVSKLFVYEILDTRSVSQKISEYCEFAGDLLETVKFSSISIKTLMIDVRL
ncbi:hypothetical protein ASPWEDRAFT_42801 [Aspergillus wentii DTO 134E9]|uniref:Uncharacterized protein n=1 Tax=Aspergillus wentii DTO 134E9 TaxID=1073089 RepID=A0A1L9RCW0_ASPWE|nr:uncharacterized protein ASPWEDRAFT_42801 [Aspergillus wentii DTO 134E9]OJJ32769.1 hypothetical protein ASPWEDRAFT_42801 [Aspergillus wentii DTO 134E9]